MRSAPILFILAVVAVMAMPLQAQQTPEPGGARSIYYNPFTGTVATPASATDIALPPPGGTTTTPPPRVPRSIGVRYWLDLDGIGPVADSRVFTTGQRVHLHVSSNADGYLAVWALGDNGHSQLMLPVAGDPAGTPVKAGHEYVSPAVRFRPPAHDERMLLLFARRKSDLPSLDDVLRDPAKYLRPLAGARDLLVETDEHTAGEIGTYVVSPRGGSLAKDIQLRHVAPTTP